MKPNKSSKIRKCSFVFAITYAFLASFSIINLNSFAEEGPIPLDPSGPSLDPTEEPPAPLGPTDPDPTSPAEPPLPSEDPGEYLEIYITKDQAGKIPTDSIILKEGYTEEERRNSAVWLHIRNNSDHSSIRNCYAVLMVKNPSRPHFIPNTTDENILSNYSEDAVLYSYDETTGKQTPSYYRNFCKDFTSGTFDAGTAFHTQIFPVENLTEGVYELNAVIASGKYIYSAKAPLTIVVTGNGGKGGNEENPDTPKDPENDPIIPKTPNAGIVL